MSHEPAHVTGVLSETWQQLYSQAEAEGIDPEEQPLIVKDESRRKALEALAEVGGAEIEDTDEGMSVRLAFEDEEEEGEHEPAVEAAVKPHGFADEESVA